MVTPFPDKVLSLPALTFLCFPLLEINLFSLEEWNLILWYKVSSVLSHKLGTLNKVKHVLMSHKKASLHG